MKRLFLFLSLAALFTSCETIKVSYDYDKSAQFTNYKTYQLTNETLSLPIQEIVRQRLISAIESEMAKKGFTKSEKPDVLIDLKVKAKEVQTATANTSGYGRYGYGRGYRYGYGGGFSTTTINFDSYKEGTFFVDMIDAAKNQLVWQGRAVGTIQEDISPEKREANIKNGMMQIFYNYPPKK